MIVYRGHSASQGRGGAGFDCHIKLYEPRIFSFLDCIQGQVHITTGNKLYFRSLRIQLEGSTFCKFQYETDNNKITSHMKTARFFPSECNDHTLEMESGCFFMIGQKNSVSSATIKSLPKGEHIFPFEVKLQGPGFPSTFSSPNGSIDYRLVVYAVTRRDDTNWTDQFVQSMSLSIRGHLNLQSNPRFWDPVVVTQKKFKSVWSKLPQLKMSLVLVQAGHLPNSRVPVQVIVENNTLDNVSLIQVELIQRVTYWDEKAHKSFETILDVAKRVLNRVETQMSLELFVHVPANTMPSFSLGRRFIEILYFLEFSVQTSTGLSVKKTADITIGSTNQEENPLADLDNIPSDEEDANFNDHKSCGWDLIPRSVSPPPSYSTLSSRRPSFDPMPPPPSYNKVVGIDDWERFNPFQPR